MKAIIQERYGPLEEVLRLETVAEPAIGEHDALVRIEAASIHVGDVFVARGVPYVMRPIFGLRRPRQRIPGTDVAGTVAAVGREVRHLRAGDEVLGWCSGALAEAAAIPEGQLVAKPSGLGFEEAAAIGVSATTALQALRDHGKVRPGQHVLVVGASGGVGTYAVQVAKSLGAEVTGVCSLRNVELVRSLGADHVIDYATEDFTTGGPRYDLILDNVGARSLSATRRALKPDGTLLSNGAPVGGWIGGLDHVIKASLASLVVRQQGRPFLSMPSAEDLSALLGLVEAGSLRAVIDRTYPLEEAPAAMAHVAARHARGTTVVRMA